MFRTRLSAALALLSVGFLSSPGFADEPALTLSKNPKLHHFVEAPAPAELAARGRVDVLLTIDVDEAGKVAKVEVAKSGGAAFDDAAVAAAKQFQFSPGEYDGKPVPVRITYAYHFLMKAPPTPTPSPQPSPSQSQTENGAPRPPSGPMVPFSGVVLGRGDRVPQGNVKIIVDDGTIFSAVTDAEGRFAFTAVTVGKHDVHLRSPLITPADEPITLNAGKKLIAKYYVESKAHYRSTVRGQKAVVETVEQTLDAEEFKRLPGAQGDTLKAIQNLPGVARAPFGGGQLVVWGSAPQDTRVYVDGVYIPTLYHFGGLRSTVNGEVVQSLVFVPGGYGVDHGRGLGGVIEVDTRRPRTDGYHGFVQLDLIDGSFLVEGPITKNLSFSVSARRSWIDAFLPIFTSSDFQLSPVYYDYQADLTWHATKHDDVDVFIFGSDDVLKVISKTPDPLVSAALDSHIYYHRGLVRWLHRFWKNATLTITPSVGYDVPFNIQATFGTNTINVDAEELEYSLRAVVRVPLGNMLRLDAGLDYEGARVSVSAVGPVSGMPRSGDNGGAISAAVGADSTVGYSNNIAPYVGATLQLFDKHLTVDPQLRLEVLSATAYRGTPSEFSSVNFLPEPRLALRYQVTKKLALKGSIGVYHQQPDFSAYSRVFGSTKIGPEFGLHYVLGGEFQITPTLHVELTGFYKDLRDLIVRGETATEPPLTNEGLGRVYGGELLVRQELWHNFFGWISYTLSRSERKDHPDQAWRLYEFDQTHILTILGSYKLPHGYQVGLRFRYVTGNPYTLVTGGFFDANAGSYSRIYGQPYSARVGSFNQLDVRFDKAWTFNRWKLAIYLDIQNFYNAKNPEAYSYNFNFTQRTSVSGLPFLPVFGIRGDF